jgi:hypothetical protein
VPSVAVPAAIYLTFVALWILGLGWFADQPRERVLRNADYYAIVAFPMAFLGTVLAGLPLSRRLLRGGHSGMARFAALGAAIGGFPFVVLMLVSRPIGRLELLFGWPALGAWCGLCAACCYWVLFVRANTLIAHGVSRVPVRGSGEPGRNRT